MRLYHYTCEHAAPRIAESGRLVPNEHPYLGGGPLVWLTDFTEPMRQGLGLTSHVLNCDRTGWRVVVDTDDAVRWPAYARSNGFSRPLREQLELPGTFPSHWWVSRDSLPIVSIDRVQG